MKRYLSRTVHCAPKFDDMTCVLSAPYNEHDFIIVPLEKWLKKKGVNFRQSCKVTKIEFAQNTSKKIVTALELDQHAVIKRTRTAPKNPRREKINVAPDDLVFFTNGSITADASIGSMEKPPLAVTKKTSSWELWESIAVKFEGFGKPSVFYGVKQKTKMESFTITFHDPLFFKLVEKLTGNKAGTGGLTTLKGSNWLMSIILPHQPYFRNQPKNVFVCWGYCLTPDATGNHVRKKMTACSGREILEELCFHLGFQKQAPEIIKNAICIPSLLPYITSQFMPRKRTDRPEVVPKGSQNFACLGQYVEIPDEIVFTVECSIRSAKIAVKKLLKLKNKIPPLHRKKYDAKSVFNAIKTMMQ
jgi:oleate hydratase